MVSSRRVPLLPSRRAEHLMGMPQAAQRWTPAMVRALPEDGNRYEVVAGELFVTPAPSFDHQQAVARLLLRLVPYVDAHGLGYALALNQHVDSGKAVRLLGWQPRHSGFLDEVAVLYGAWKANQG